MSWPHVALTEAATIARTGVAPENIVAGTTYVGLENIDGQGDFIGVGSVDAGELASTKFRFTKDQVLFGKLRPYLKKTARPSFDGVCSTDILPMSPAEHVDRDYLFHVLRRQSFVDEVTSLCAGANLPRISPSVLGAMQIPLPPLAEQRRIAAILDKADVLRAKRREAIAKLDQLLQSVFLDMFGEPVANPKGWTQEQLMELGRVQTGATPPTSEDGMFEGAVPFVTPGDLGGIITVSRRSLTVTGASKSRLAPSGSVLVCCIGATIGKMGYAQMDCAFNQQINAITWGDKVKPKYGYYALRFFAKEIAHQGSSTTMPILKKSAFERIMLPVPTMGLQEDFERVVSQIERRQHQAQRALCQSDDLSFSLQRNCFSGGARHAG